MTDHAALAAASLHHEEELATREAKIGRLITELDEARKQIARAEDDLRDCRAQLGKAGLEIARLEGKCEAYRFMFGIKGQE